MNCFYQKLEEDESNSEECYLKQTAFNQYQTISQCMTDYEKEKFSKFLQEGTFVVNNVLKRNILKLKYTSPPCFPLEKSKELDKSLTPIRIMKQRSKPKFNPKKETTKSKFTTVSTAIKWLIKQPVSGNVDLALAEKLMKMSDHSSKPNGMRSDFKISQAKCKFKIIYEKFYCKNLSFISDDSGHSTSKTSNLGGNYWQQFVECI